LSNSKNFFEDFFNAYLFSDDGNKLERKINKILNFILILFIIFIGGLAGLPWVKAGLDFGKSLHCYIIGSLTALAVVVSYGATTMWIFFQLKNSIIIHKLYTIKLYNKRNQKLSPHFICHFFGVIATIPTLYISYILNHKIFYCIIAAITSYVFSTFGIYQILNLVIKPLFDTKAFFNLSLDRKLKYQFANFVEYFPFNNIKEKQLTLENFYNLFFLSEFFLKCKSEVQSKSIRNKKYFKRLFILYFPINDLIFQSIIVFNALNYVYIPPMLCYIFTIIIVISLFGLNLFAINRMTEILYQIFISFLKKEFFFLNWKNFFILLALILSSFSALTNAYIAYVEVSESSFSFLSLVVAFSIWVPQMILQTIGLYSIVKIIYRVLVQNFGSEKNNKMNQKLSNIIRELPDDLFNDYIKTYKPKTS